MGFHTLKIKNRLQANRIARLYIQDDKYLMMAPDRMHHIATQLLDKVDRELVMPLRKIIEVCGHGATTYTSSIV